MSWTKTGTDKYWNVTSGQTALTVSAGTVGDLRVIEFLTISSSVSISSLSGGGVTTWTRAGSVNAVSTNSIGAAANAEVWYGRITGTGTALTATYSGTVGSTSCRGMQRDYRSSRGASLFTVQAQSFTQTNNHTSSSPLAWPSLTSGQSGQLAVGVMGNFGSMSSPSGSTSGYTYTTDTDANYHVYKLSCGASEVEAPTLTFTGTDGWYAMQVIFDDGFLAVSGADSGLGTDTATVKAKPTGSESALGTDAATSKANVPGTESGLGSELASIKLTGTAADSAHGTDSATVGIAAGDSAAGDDESTQVVATQGVETALGTDHAIAGPEGDDTTVLAPGPRVIVVDFDDRVYEVDFEQRIYFIPADDRTYLVPEDPRGEE